MHTAPFAARPASPSSSWPATAAASAQGGITEAPDKTRGATKQPDTGEVHSVTGPSTTSVAPEEDAQGARQGEGRLGGGVAVTSGRGRRRPGQFARRSAQ